MSESDEPLELELLELLLLLMIGPGGRSGAGGTMTNPSVSLTVRSIGSPIVNRRRRLERRGFGNGLIERFHPGDKTSLLASTGRGGGILERSDSIRERMAAIDEARSDGG